MDRDNRRLPDSTDTAPARRGDQHVVALGLAGLGFSRRKQ
jgi:hypothetical protein